MTGQVKELSPDGPFAQRLRSLMAARKVGADILGREADVSARLIRKYLAGTVEPRDFWGDPTENAHKLALALDVPVSELMPPVEREAA